jgi:hypothetical protein
MNVLKTLAVVGVAVAAVCLWKEYDAADGAELKTWIAEHAGSRRSGGFEAIPLPDGVSARGIVVFAPKHCTSEAAQRTDVLVRYLSDLRIAYVRTDRADYSSLASPEEASQVTAVMNGPVPVVYVNGKAKANPTPEEVVAEYRGETG